MQKISIIFVIITLSLTVQAQMKLRNLQTITDTPDEAARNEITKDSTNAPDFVELNNLGVRKALVEKNYEQAIELFTKAVNAQPECFRCKFNLGRSLMSLTLPK